MLDPAEFEQSTLAAQSLDEAQADPMYVDNNISNTELGQDAPYPFVLRYRNGPDLTIPLSAIFFEGLSGARITAMRRHAQSRRIVPFQIGQNDSALRDPALSGVPVDQAMDRVLRPRFDPALTPNIDLINEAQSLFLANGILKIIAIRVTAPPLRGAASSAAGALAGRTAAKTVLTRTGTVTVEATLAKGLINPAGKLAQVLKAIQPRFVVEQPDSLLKAFNIIADATKSVGLEPGIVKSGTFASEHLVIANVGNVTTTIVKTGEVIIRQHDIILLRLIP